jgi:homoserine O-acetyltransferase/O-succinyltransferase
VSYQIFESKAEFKLENGEKLKNIHLAYHSFGELNESRSNVVWIFHALTANSNPFDWWNDLVQNNQNFNLATHFVICVNIPGSCYGSIGPLSINPFTDEPFYHNFPLFTNRDVVKAFQLLKNYLGITCIQFGIGGSLGGQQLIEWAIEEQDLFKTIIPLATNAKHSPWGIAYNASQRWAIENDPTWNLSNHNAGTEGLKLARSIALLSYRTSEIYNQKQLHNFDDINEAQKFEHKAISYQKYQGEKLAKRFNAYSYYFLSKSMDLHDVGRGRGGLTKALASIKSKALIISVSSDLLFPVSEQIILAQYMSNAEHFIIESNYGHDGFLVETKKINEIITQYLLSAV